ncbi:hypothetical protein BVI434_110014 [Burkholderia vietnamiensis]|nr:hypothetical protein BVI434_110014 [Burkholderia vietnamiensis]
MISLWGDGRPARRRRRRTRAPDGFPMVRPAFG